MAPSRRLRVPLDAEPLEPDPLDADPLDAQQLSKEPVPRPPRRLLMRAASACCTVRSLLIVSYIASWYVCSIGLTLYNKWLFSIHKFNYPIIVTLIHMALKAPFARLAMLLFGLPPVCFTSRAQYLTMVVPVAVATALDVVLSNSSFSFLTVTFYTIIKSSVPVWILLFSFALGLQRPSLGLVAIIVVICAGISLASLDDNLRGAWQGVTLCNLASICAGARWALSQLLLQPQQRTQFRASPDVVPKPGVQGAASGAANAATRVATLTTSRPFARDGEIGSSLLRPVRSSATEPGASAIDDEPDSTFMAGSVAAEEERPTIHPVSYVWYMSPWAALVLLPAALGKELRPLLASEFVRDRAALAQIVGLASVGALIAFFLLLGELMLVRATSGLTLSVAGIFKEVLTIYASVSLLGDELTRTNMIGLSVTLLGVAFYNVLMLRRGAAADGSESDNDSGSVGHCESGGDGAIPSGDEGHEQVQTPLRRDVVVELSEAHDEHRRDGTNGPPLSPAALAASPGSGSAAASPLAAGNRRWPRSLE
jgi:drug/metabolite transporter (DMT)-like permease